MKKLIAMLMVVCCVFALAACGTEKPVETTKAPETTAAPATTAAPETTAATETTAAPETTEPAASVMDYAAYVAAELDSEVCVETYVQAHQSWWDGKITCYTQDENGGYFLYNMACSEEDAAKLVPGTKIRVSGYKSEWAGEVEIMDATFEIIEGSYIAEAKDVTALLGTDALADCQNQFAAFKGMTVEASTDKDGNEAAFLYAWDGSGAHDSNSDLYFKASVNGQTYTFCVESYLCGNDTAVYAAVEALKVGDVIDMEGFLYWYEGVQPHITAVSAAN